MSATAKTEAAEPTAPADATRRRGLDAVAERLGEWVNPILVKEARQALKSRQFMLTFTLVLVAGWIWSILGVAFMTPEIFHSARGSQMLIGYVWVLLFPLIVIVPFGAFRSLAVEIEDGTFELISVSTLTPRQIIDGKMGSALLQGMIYLSALSPCIAFTYLLRGIDILTIALLIFYSVMQCVVLCVCGLFLATVSSTRMWQLMVSVALIIGLFVGFGYTGAGVSEFLSFNEPLPIREGEFWIIQLAIVSAVLSFAYMLYAASAARITFPSENRSTHLRWIMLTQHCILVAWMVYTFSRFLEPLTIVPFAAGATVYWYVMGSMMIGETAQISQRVRRSLPQTILARTLLTWFTPGPFKGYQFAVLNMLSLCIFVSVLFYAARDYNISQQFVTIETCIWCIFVMWAYLAFYLGIGHLLVRAGATVTTTSPLFGFLVGILVFLVGTLLPVTMRLSFAEYIRSDFEWWEITNPFAVFSQLIQPRPMPQPTKLILQIRVATILMGVIVYLINIIFGVGQMRYEREETPERVRLDDELANASASSDVAPVHPLDATE